MTRRLNGGEDTEAKGSDEFHQIRTQKRRLRRLSLAVKRKDEAAVEKARHEALAAEQARRQRRTTTIIFDPKELSTQLFAEGGLDKKHW
jgi:hypothetical protein